MTSNERLALWQGWVLADAETNLWDHPVHGDIRFDFPKDYLNDDAAAMSLLDALVEKGHEPKLQYYHNIKQWGMMPDEDCGYEWLDDTRRAAVVAAVLEMLGKEDV